MASPPAAASSSSSPLSSASPSSSSSSSASSSAPSASAAAARRRAAAAAPPRRRLLVAALLGGSALAGEAFRVRSKYIVVSSPGSSNVYYAAAPSFGLQALETPGIDSAVEASVLIDGKASKCTGYGCISGQGLGLESPGALAVYEGQDGVSLFIADVKQTSIFAYNMYRIDSLRLPSGISGLSVGSQRRVRKNVTALGMAVDSWGNLFYTTAEGNVEMLNRTSLKDVLGFAPSGKELEPKVLYTPDAQGDAGATVANPAGIAADNFFVYWANSGGDSNTGVVIKGFEDPAASKEASKFKALAANSDLNEAVATDVCVARDNVFFTGESKSIFAVKTLGGVIAEVARNLTQPAGCAYDEENTIYIADAGANAVVAMPSNLPSLRPVNFLAKVISVKGPQGIAVVGAGRLGSSDAPRRATPRALTVSAAAAAAVAWTAARAAEL